MLQQLSKDFEKSHPGREDQLVFKDFNSLVGTVPRAPPRAAAGRDRGEPGLPDRCPAREGEADPPAHEVRQEVRLGQALRAVDLGMFRWTPDGKSFGKGPVWGIAQTGQNVVAFNKRKLRELGFNPNKMPQTFGVRPAPRPAAGEAARRRARDRARQQGGVRVHPPLRRHPGRLRQGADGPQLDLPRARLAVRHPGRSRRWASSSNGARQATSTSTTTRSATTPPQPSSRRARASSGSAETGTRRSSRPASAPRTSA